MKKVKALVLFSGGLDSLLAVKVLEKQGVEVTGICFSSVFFEAKKVKEIAQKNNIKLFVEDFNSEILKLVKNPPHGLGKNMNPCVDCHSKMFELAGQFAQKNDYDFLASGEVLGQRPFSQNKQALEEILKISGIEILRPLSAKLLPETEIEKRDLVDREKLLDIQGRQRNQQMKLAEEFDLKEFQSPAGGCLLTDPAFSLRLKKALNEFSGINFEDVELLKNGRIYWLRDAEDKFLLLTVVGRHKEDNQKLESLAQQGDLFLEPVGLKGPNVLIRIFKGNFDFDGKIIEAEISLEKEEILEDFSWKKEADILKKIVEEAGWYITSVRGNKVSFKIK
jgi:tRNA U34 2-thiouridine synthase MnmA/TrmU